MQALRLSWELPWVELKEPFPAWTTITPAGLQGRHPPPWFLFPRKPPSWRTHLFPVGIQVGSPRKPFFPEG